MIGEIIHRFDSVTSTNDLAREFVKNGAMEGTVVVAAEQTKGRGRRGRSWISPHGVNLLASIILRPQIPPERLGELAFVAAVGVAGALEGSCGLDARVKWPNDIKVGGRKIAGILVEAGGGATIVGIGVNVNWTEMPEEIAESATSVALELAHPVSLESVLKALIADLDIAYRVYLARGFGRTLDDWRKIETTMGSSVTVEIDGNRMHGLAVDVNEHGSLVIELPSGERMAIPAATAVISEEPDGTNQSNTTYRRRTGRPARGGAWIEDAARGR